jgi:hypothetical protein
VNGFVEISISIILDGLEAVDEIKVVESIHPKPFPNPVTKGL